MIKAIIFDFDGVILNSTEIKTNAFINIFEKKYKKFLPKIIEHHNFELDSFLDIMVEDLNRYKEYVLVNIDGLTLQKRVHGTRYKIETNDAMNRDILRYWLWKWIRPRTKYKKLKPSLWNHLQRSGKGFELGLARGCIPEWWVIK